jgi:predicted nucleotidyltransferase component of viral defense system
MDRNSIYYKQVQLLMQVLPFVAKQECFALKGGTAINLFVREFPRLSVDIDLFGDVELNNDELQDFWRCVKIGQEHIEEVLNNFDEDE